MTKTEDHIITDEEAKAQWGVAGQTEEQELRKAIVKAGTDFAIDRNDALSRSMYNRENALEHYEEQFVDAVMSLIHQHDLALIDRVEAEARVYEAVTLDSLPGYDSRTYKKAVPVEALATIKASIKQEGDET